MRRTIPAAIAALAALALTVSACTPSSQNGDPTGTATGGDGGPSPDLNIGNFLDITSWDPALADIGFDGPYLSAVYDALIALDADGNPVPSLATGWEFAEDRLSLTLDIRTDAVFSDGAPVDADAVVTSLEHLKEGARSSEAYLNVDSFEVVDEDTVQINLTQPDDTLLYLMGLGRSYVVSPEAIAADTLTAAAVGSGPYVLDTTTSVAGSEYHFTKVEDHWDAGTYPFPSLAIYPIMDATARHNAMLSGQINVNYADIANLDQAEQQGWTIAERVSGWVGLQFTEHTGATLEPLGDVRVRQALNHAFDGAGILQAVGNGAGETSRQVFPVGSEGNDPSLDGQYAYDIDKAKELLAEAGYADGFDVTMPMSPIFQMWQPAVEQALGEIGVSVTWDDMQQPDYQLNAATYPMFITFIAMDGNAAATVARQVTNVQWFNPNPDYTEFPELVTLVDQIHATSGDEQLAAIGDLNATLTELAWWSVWYQSANVYFSAPGITVQPVIGMMFPTLRYIQQG